jgi:GNAT superfamily N-acetyltransferase
MIETEQFMDMVYGFWARRFEYEASEFDRPCTYIYEDETLAGTGKAVLYQIGEISIARLGADLLAQIGLEKMYPCAIKALDVEGLWETMAGRFAVAVEYTLLDWFLDAARFIPQVVPGEFTALRMDGERDDGVLQAFYGASSADDLEKAEILVDEPDPVIFGLFDRGGQMAAYASHRYWEDLLCDIGVLVHPDHRGQGLGAAAVSTLCEWCIENEKIPMYRVLEDNPHSMTIPRALGFQMMVRVDGLKISKEA